MLRASSVFSALALFNAMRVGMPPDDWERWVKSNLEDHWMIFKMCQVSSFAFEPGVVVRCVAVLQVPLLYKSLQPQNLLDKYIVLYSVYVCVGTWQWRSCLKGQQSEVEF